MNIKLQGNYNLSVMNQPMFAKRGLKSTQEKLERQAKCNRQVAFFENQKENLKKMECDTVEEIARKLEMFHTYGEEIAAAKAAYNSEQMFHIMDEAEEIGEKIAESAKKAEPKTPEERKEEAAEEIREEAAGTGNGEGILEEMLESAERLEEAQQQEAEDLSEQTAEDLSEQEAEDLSKRRTEELSGQRTEKLSEERPEESSGERLEESSGEKVQALSDGRSKEEYYESYNPDVK